MRIRPNEIEIRGLWTSQGGRVVADENCRRIEQLIATELTKVGHDASGWDTLYCDPRDGRYWELVYPEGDLHGGGPPTLRQVGLEDLRAKYGME